MPKSHGHHWWYTYPSKKYESQIGSSSQLLGKINVPNHQPVILSYQNCHCMEYGDPPFSETPKEPDSMSRYLNSASIASFKRCNQKKKLGWFSHVIPHFGQTHGILSILHWPWGLHTRRGSSQLFLHVPNDTLQVLARLAHHDGPWVDS